MTDTAKEVENRFLGLEKCYKCDTMYNEATYLPFFIDGYEVPLCKHCREVAANHVDFYWTLRHKMKMDPKYSRELYEGGSI